MAYLDVKMNQYMVNYRFLVLSMKSGSHVRFREHMKDIGRCFDAVQDFWNYWITIQTFGSPMWDVYCDESGM